MKRILMAVMLVMFVCGSVQAQPTRWGDLYIMNRVYDSDTEALKVTISSSTRDTEIIVLPGDEFEHTVWYNSLQALILYATDDDTITAAGFDFRPTSCTLAITDRLATHTTSFHWDGIGNGGDRLSDLISWGNDYEFKGLELYYTGIATEVAHFQVADDSITLTITGGVDGLAEGTSSYILSGETLDSIIVEINADRYTAGVGSGTWTIVASSGTSDADDLTDQGVLAFNVTGTGNALRVPIAGYDAAGAGWVFAAWDSSTVYTTEVSTNLMVGGTFSRKIDTTSLGLSQGATIFWDRRRYLNFEIPAVTGDRIFLRNVHTNATFASGTTNTQIFEGTTQMYANDQNTTTVVNSIGFDNDVYIGASGTAVIVRVDSGASTTHISTGWIRIMGFSR